MSSEFPLIQSTDGSSDFGFHRYLGKGLTKAFFWTVHSACKCMLKCRSQKDTKRPQTAGLETESSVWNIKLGLRGVFLYIKYYLMQIYFRQLTIKSC